MTTSKTVEPPPAGRRVEPLVVRNAVVSSARAVIESQLLTELNDKSKVAILLTKVDLDFWLSVLECAPADYSQRCDWIADLSQLRRSAFGD